MGRFCLPCSFYFVGIICHCAILDIVVNISNCTQILQLFKDSPRDDKRSAKQQVEHTEQCLCLCCFVQAVAWARAFLLRLWVVLDWCLPAMGRSLRMNEPCVRKDPFRYPKSPFCTFRIAPQVISSADTPFNSSTNLVNFEDDA